MDALKDQVPKLPEHRLFVTRENFAIFGESTHKGTINRNCYESIKRTKIELPKWFRKPNDKYVTLGKLEGNRLQLSLGSRIESVAPVREAQAVPPCDP